MNEFSLLPGVGPLPKINDKLIPRLIAREIQELPAFLWFHYPANVFVEPLSIFGTQLDTKASSAIAATHRITAISTTEGALKRSGHNIIDLTCTQLEIVDDWMRRG